MKLGGPVTSVCGYIQNMDVNSDLTYILDKEHKRQSCVADGRTTFATLYEPVYTKQIQLGVCIQHSPMVVCTSAQSDHDLCCLQYQL